MTATWTRAILLGEVPRDGLTLSLEPDAGERAKIAHDLGLETLPALTAQVTLRPWFDGVEITGRLHAVVEQICSVSLDPFEQPLEGAIEVRAVPAASPQAPAADGGEIEYDPEAPDPPDVLAGDAVDVAAYVVEQLALEIDPFPRKPGAEFEFTPPAEPESPFAVLKGLKDRKP